MSHILLVLTRDLTQGSNMLTECYDIVTHPGHFAIAKFKSLILVWPTLGFGPGFYFGPDSVFWAILGFYARLGFGPDLDFGPD